MAHKRNHKEPARETARVAPSSIGIGALLSHKELSRGDLGNELTLMAQDAFRAGIAEAADMVARRADIVRCEKDNPDERALTLYRAAVELSRMAEGLTYARIDKILEAMK